MAKRGTPAFGGKAEQKPAKIPRYANGFGAERFPFAGIFGFALNKGEKRDIMGTMSRPRAEQKGGENYEYCLG